MQIDNAVLLEPGTEVKIGETVIDGQILVPMVRLGSFHAPTKKRPYYNIKIDLIMPVEGAPLPNDVSWFTPGSPKCRLRDIQVLLMFDEGTFNLERQNAEA